MEIVSEFRRRLIQRIGQERFDLWFSAGVDMAVNRDGDQSLSVTVTAPSQFVLDRIRKQFATDLHAAAQKVLDCVATVLFQIDSALKVDSSSTDNKPTKPQTLPLPTSPIRSTDATPRARRFAGLKSFVSGSGNLIAASAAQKVSENLGVMSPLFLYGPTGCGKTHLLEGIWSNARHGVRPGRALFLSAEQFTTYFLDALRGSGLPNFRRKCRDVDLLVIDDVQFFAGKRATIVELQHTIDTLIRQGRQLVMAADRPPGALHQLGPEVIARISGGLVCGIEELDSDTRRRIVGSMAMRLGSVVPPDVLDLLANELPADGRQIAGALNRLEATSLALQQPVTLDLARSALKDLLQATSKIVQLPDIEKAVCEAFGLAPSSLRDGRKTKSASHPRMLAMWLARKHTRAASSEISQFFGRRSHSTVISAEKKVQRWVADGATVQMGPGSCNVADAIHRAEAQLRTG